MGSTASSIIFQPIILATAASLLGIAVYYQEKKRISGDEIFKINVGIAIVIMIIAILINFISAL